MAGMEAAVSNHVNGTAERAETDTQHLSPHDTKTDSYEEVYEPSKRDTALPSVKTEPTSSTLEEFPVSYEIETKSVGLDGVDDHPTSRTVTNLKHGLTSRASSSERSSPATSVKPASNKKAGTGATKKGMAKKPAVKKRKVNDADGDSVDGRRSNTPVSRTSKTKKQDSVSVTGSPAPEDRKPKKRGKRAGNGEDEDESEIFCICRRPDNHTWMIGCDGGCEDWFHGKCVDIDPRDADLIDKYICPNCSQRGKGCTTWKPMCRLFECRQPARVKVKPPSKYCSDEHGREFMRRQTRHLRLGSSRPHKSHKSQDEDLGSMGGILTAGDLSAVIMGVGSAEEFRKLGNRIVSPPPEADENEASPVEENQTTESAPQGGKKLGLDVDVKDLMYTADESAKLEKLRKLREDLIHRKEMLAVRTSFITLVRQRSKSVVERLKLNDPKGGWKDICGFDSRLSWSDEEFDEWRLSDAGKIALLKGTAEALASSYPVTPTSTDADGDTAMDVENDKDEMAFLTRGICTKKRCERHKQWVKVQQQDIMFEETTADEDLAKCEDEAQAVVERAALRTWAETDAE
ncbi:hypothetical protein N7474_009745 [Penicillium riverlandense]|uniref:uncharacterized protein n=1 Tax=Penicillium riverlandense TaxID=1903569 RepID=UPI002549BF7A|nr:uncharacterized protein N7474_009745 [Penicillium riverlandense]KAJ5808476.1 hypothetical protein N7474_009745 [Penicillium riverlandense]